MKTEVLHLTDIPHRRFRRSFRYGAIAGKCRCALGYMLYNSRFGHHAVLFKKEIIFPDSKATCALVTHNLQQLVHHHDGRALWYEFFNLTDGSRCSHTDR